MNVGLSDDPLEWPRYAGLTLERYNFCRIVAGRIVQCHLEDNDWGAYEEYRGISDFDEVNVVWKIIKNYSSLRSAIKRLYREELASRPNQINGSEQRSVADS